MHRLLPVLLLLGAAPAATPVDLLSWPGQDTAALACILKTLGTPDKNAPCSDKPAPAVTADRCKQNAAWSAGPKGSGALARKLHPAGRAVRLNWEAGKLQSVEVEMSGTLAANDVRKAFNLPERFINPQPNVLDITIHPCNGGTCLLLQGFQSARMESCEPAEPK